ncbi:MAG: FeoB-associated Cys-rich membrane protein [Candidatus Omnitrophica bacterium]|nr:FeoB-associated Cys-rich membrane protein [Candidatus Omnitrophota bacterium]
MEKIIVLTVIFVSIGFLIRYFMRSFKSEGPCFGCEDHCRCGRQ